MADELFSLGLLDDQEYHSILKKILNGAQFSVSSCELLRKIVEAKESFRKTSAVSDGTLHSVYRELLQQCLLPRLNMIIEKYSVSTMSSSNLDMPPQASEAETTIINLLTKNDQHLKDDNAQEYHEGSPVTYKTDELMLASKLSWLIVEFLKIISFTSQSQLSIDVSSKNVEAHNSHYVNQNDLIPFINLFDNIAKNITVHYIDTMVDEDRHKVKILSLIFTNLLKDDWCMQHGVLLQPIKTVIRVTLKMIEMSHDTNITALLLTLIIQPYLDVTSEDKSETLQKLWDIVKKFYRINGDFVILEKNATGFFILCFIAGYMFEGGCLYHIGNDSALWKIIQYGLVHTNPLSRKRCQYILKRFVDHYSSSLSVKEFKSEYLCWPENEKREFVKLWNDFFLVVETLEEKQAHVVKPVLEKLDNLIHVCCRNGKLFHVSWTLVIFKRIFDQDNKNIKQWGVMKMLQLKFPQEVLMKGVLSFITLHLLSALSDYSLYSRDSSQQPRTVSGVGDQIGIFLAIVIGTLDFTVQKNFMCILIEKIFDGRSWGAIPLFYLIRGLALMPKTAVWNFKVVKSAVANFEGCLSTQEIVLRSSSQCDLLKAIFKHLVPVTTFLEICDIVGHFRRKESWCRGTVLWKAIVKDLGTFQETWQNRFSSIQCAIERFLNTSETINPVNIALGINLLLENISRFDNVSEKNSNILALLSPVNDFFRDCYLRPYLDQKKFIWALELINETLEIFCDKIPSECFQKSDELGQHLSCLTEGIDSVAQLFVLEIKKFDQPYDFEVISHCLQLFTHCSNLETLKHIPRTQYPLLLDSCFELLHQDNSVKVSFGTLVLEHLVAHYYESAIYDDKIRIGKLVHFKIVCYLENGTQRKHIEGCSTDYATKLCVETTRSHWSCVHLLLCKNISLKTEMFTVWNELQNNTIDALIDAVISAGRISVLYVFRVAVTLASSIILSGTWQELLKVMWVSSREYRKGCNLYRSLVGCVAELLFHRDALLNMDYHGFITQMSKEMLVAGEGVQGIAAHVSQSLVTTLARENIRNNLDPKSCVHLVQEVLVPLLMFGSVFRKQYKVVQDTTAFIKECGHLYSTNSLIER
nr:uncharacterized protein LOC128688259 [Cherax quadricarinatus]